MLLLLAIQQKCLKKDRSNMNISIILPTYNPLNVNLTQTLHALNNQTLEKEFWELIIVDNNSSNQVISQCVSNIKTLNAQVVNENRQGLTRARIKGLKTAASEICIFVDDDNILQYDYLEIAYNIMTKNSHMGAIGGVSVGKYEIAPPSYINEISSLLAVRNLGDKTLQYSLKEKNADMEIYPECSPIGAGMIVRKSALQAYIRDIESSDAIIQDRTGTNLSSGGDNDIVLHILKSGFAVGYFPELMLEHIIPIGRLQPRYIAELNKASSKSWVMLLNKHHMLPWKPIPPFTLLLRKIKAFFMHKAWQGDLNMIQWKGSCGIFEGLAELYAKHN